ncbi:18.1 kDa class I heat shock protein-like [Macadamia integrifolia]|uniref:18.1 kDa class I heat shock protein-like n=1 Tax=Macadamia integrifolia TaxID=60698 RepID=UPI001C4F479F|nr:18.1 kDa class I heat shock protein-like [Macadamia integrifolia]
MSLFPSGSRPRTNFFDYDDDDSDSWNLFNIDFPRRVPFDSGYPFSDSLSLPHSHFSDKINEFTIGPFNRNETPEAHVFRVEIPGLNKDEVKVEVEDGDLKISGERSRKKEEKKKKWCRFESSSGKFHCSYTLPENAKIDQMEVSMENGVLTVTVPK